jgi:hypothetical protein
MLMNELLVMTLAQQPQTTVQFTLSLPAILALVAGILILVMPRLLSYIVAIYLIVIGLIGLFNLTI